MTPEITGIAACFFGGFGLLKVTKMKEEEGIFLLYILLILYKQQETSKGEGLEEPV